MTDATKIARRDRPTLGSRVRLSREFEKALLRYSNAVWECAVWDRTGEGYDDMMREEKAAIRQLRKEVRQMISDAMPPGEWVK